MMKLHCQGLCYILNVFNSMSVMPSPFGGHKHKQERNQVICSSEKELLVLNSHIYLLFNKNKDENINLS